MNDALFAIGVLAFIILAWVAGGGPNHPLSFSGPIVQGPTIGSGVQIGTTGSGSGASSSLTNSQIQQKVNQINSQVKTLSKQVSQAVAFGTPSPYKGIVHMSHGVSGAGSSNPDHETIMLYVSANAAKPVDITGWRLESEATGNAGTIPQGTSLPRSGVINPEQDIVLQPGERAVVSTGRSPIGASFRENECIGYLSEYQKFYPSLPMTCPSPYTELQKYYGPNLIRDAACIDYVRSLPRCKLIASAKPGLTTACSNFVTTYLNYNGCVQAHQNDSGFQLNTWRIFLGHDKSMWRRRYEIVKLLDKQGKTVDMFQY